MQMMADGGGGSGSSYALNTQREMMAIIGSPDSTALDRAETMWRDTAASARDIHDLITKRLTDLTGEGGWTGEGASAYAAAIRRHLLDPLTAYAKQAEKNAEALQPVNRALSSAIGSALVNDIPWDRDTNWEVNRKQIDQSLWSKVDEFVTGQDEDYEREKAEAPYLVLNGDKQTVQTVDHTRWESLLQIYPQLKQTPKVYQQTDNTVSPQVHRFDQLMEALGLNSNQASTVRRRVDAVDEQLTSYAPGVSSGSSKPGSRMGDPGGGLPGQPGGQPGPGDPGGRMSDGMPIGGDSGPRMPPSTVTPIDDPTRPGPRTEPPGSTGPFPSGPNGPTGPGPQPIDPSVISPGPGPAGPNRVLDPSEISNNLPGGTEAAGLNPGAAAGLSNLGGGNLGGGSLGGPGSPGGSGINVGSGAVPPMGPMGGAPMGAGATGNGAGAPGKGAPGGSGNPLGGGRSGNSFGIGPNGRGMVNPGSVGPIAGPQGSGTPGSGMPGAGMPPMGNRKNDTKDEEKGPAYNSWLEEDEDVWLDSQSRT